MVNGCWSFRLILQTNKNNMTTQEIIKNLSSLEQELTNVKSARMLAEETISSYKDIQGDIRVIISEFEKIIKSLNIVSCAFDSGQVSFQNEMQETVKTIQNRLNELNVLFTNQCEAAIGGFFKSAEDVGTHFNVKINSIVSECEANNISFKSNVADLTNINTSFINGIESIISLKDDIKTLQIQMNDFQKRLNQALDEIITQLCESEKTQYRYFNGLIEELKTSQSRNLEKLENLISISRNNYNSIKNNISNLTGRLENGIQSGHKSSKIIKILLCVNVLVSIFTILFITLKSL